MVSVVSEPVAVPASQSLFSVVFQVCRNVFRFAILVFDLVAIADLPDPFENNLVAHLDPLLDDVDVLQFVLDGDLALMRHVIFVNDENVALFENFKYRPLRDDDGVILNSAD